MLSPGASFREEKNGRRRVLAIHRSQAAAQQATFGEQGWIKLATGVEVRRGRPGTTPDRPWAIAAAKPKVASQ
jgi:hypothetical protein